MKLKLEKMMLIEYLFTLFIYTSMRALFIKNPHRIQL